MVVWGCEVITPLAEVATSFSRLSRLFRFGGLGVRSHNFCIAVGAPRLMRIRSYQCSSFRCGCCPQLCSRRHAVHARTLLYAQFANKRSTPHRYHTAASPWPVSRTFQLGGLGVRSHNFCEVLTSDRGVLGQLGCCPCEGLPAIPSWWGQHADLATRWYDFKNTNPER